MVVKITSLEGNGRQIYKFKNRSGILFVLCSYSTEITCGRKSRGDEKQLIDLEWPNRREGEYPTPLWYSVTAVRKGYDLYNRIHVCGISQFTHNAHLLTAPYALARYGAVSIHLLASGIIVCKL